MRRSSGALLAVSGQSRARLARSDFTDAIEYAQHCSRAHDAVISVYDEAGNVIGDDEHLGDFKAVAPLRRLSRERKFCVEKPN